MKEMEMFGIPINSINNLIEEKNWFGVNLAEIERIRRPWIKIKEALIFKNPINFIRGVIEDNNLYLEKVWPKFIELKDQWLKWNRC